MVRAMGIVGWAWVAGWAADYGGRQENVLDGAGDDRRGVCRGCREDGIVVSTVPWVLAWSSAIARGQGPVLCVGACSERRHGAPIRPNEAGGARGWCPRSKVSMTIMRPPQHGQGRSGGKGSKVSSS